MPWSPHIQLRAHQILQCVWYLVTFRFDRVPFRRIVDRLAKKIAIGRKRVPFPAWTYSDDRPLALIIDSIFPTPDRDSGSIDAINLVDALHSLNYQVVFVAVSDGDATARLTLENKGVIVSDVGDREDSFFAAIKPFLAVAFLSRVWSGGRFLESIRRECPSAKIIFNTVDLSNIREERVARLNNDRLRLRLAARTKVRELTLVKLADATIVVSHEEHRLLTGLVPLCNVYTVPLARDVVPQMSSFDQSSDVAFIGGYMMETNVDAVIYFLEEIWPIVRGKLPHAKFIAMGAAMPDVLLKRSDPGFVPRGYVENLSSALNGIRVMVAPLRAGAGAKGKVATALAHGIPCVASSIAAEGMGFQDRHSILIAESPQEFAAKVCEVYTCSALWSSLSNAGLHLMARDYSPTENNRRIANIIEAVGVPLLNQPSGPCPRQHDVHHAFLDAEMQRHS